MPPSVYPTRSTEELINEASTKEPEKAEITGKIAGNEDSGKNAGNENSTTTTESVADDSKDDDMQAIIAIVVTFLGNHFIQGSKGIGQWPKS